MSKSIRAACAKLTTVETATKVLMRLPEAGPLLPSLMWMRQETEQVLIALCKMSDQDPMKVARKVDAIIDHVKRLKDELPDDAGHGEPEPHSDVYLASACTLILDDLLQVYRDPVKIRMIKPLHECAVNIEATLDEGCVLYDARKEADLFVERIYREIDEANY